MKRSALIILLLFLTVIAYLTYRCVIRPGSQNPEPAGNTDSTSLPAPVITEYGLPVDSFSIVSGIIGKNQTLAGLLKQYHVTPGKIARIVECSGGIFDLRQIRAGNPYKLFSARDSLQSPGYLVYEHTPVNYLFIDLTDSVKITYEAKKIDIITRTGSGVVTSSLWEAMLAYNLNPMLAFELSEIYAWTIDFFGLHDGDSFKVIFDEQYADTTCVGLGKIHGACFRHAGQDYYAIPFIQDSVESYFDQEGNSLRRAFLKAPLRFSRISSRYSHNRLHPILKIRRPHLAVDYSAPVGTPVYAIGDGKIIQASFLKNSGNMVKIRHNSVYTTAYLHLSHFARGISLGTSVRQGDLIGYVGSTGLSTGPHLDFRFYKNGSPVDPLKVEAPPVEPVRDTNRPAFDSVRTKVISKLDHIHAGPDSTEAFSSR